MERRQWNAANLAAKMKTKCQQVAGVPI